MRRLRTFAAALAAILLGLPALAGAHMGVQQLVGNFHTVIEGELYRSAQPDAEDMADHVERFGVRTVLNLRDEDEDYRMRGARAAAESAGVVVIDYPMSSARPLSIEEAEELAQIMRQAEKPLLIHCDHGANRTGLASAIYVGAVAGRGEWQAEFQLSPYYGHVPIEGIGRYEMYRSWDRFEETLGF